ncbi:MAG: SDR family oxidoreductase [Bacteroidia bacterium]|nr:SDR family oxidoreductase [Bacteroidia bacterium]
MARYLITGGAGFIGSHIVEDLLKRGEFVRVLDNFSTGYRRNLDQFINDIELIEGDIRYYHVALQAVKGIDFVLHQAALGSVPRSINDPITSNDINANGTLTMLYAAKEARVKRFIYASSSSVYGDNPESPKIETMTPSPKSPYAVSKLSGEHYCQVFHKVYGLETVALRYFNVFGPRQDPNSQYAAVIPKFLSAMLKAQKPTVHGDGTQSRDFTFVKNVVNANLLACDSPNVSGKVFNIACNSTHSLLDLIQHLNTILGKNIEPKFEPPRIGDIKNSLASIVRAQTELMYQPETNFVKGLQILVEKF